MCQLLQKLSLDNVEGLYDRDLDKLCQMATSLQVVEVFGFQSVSEQWEAEIMANECRLFGVKIVLHRRPVGYPDHNYDS